MVHNNELFLYNLLDMVSKLFNSDELAELFLIFNLDYDELEGKRKSTKVRMFLITLARQNRLPELIMYLRKERPRAVWEDVPSDFKPPENFSKQEAAVFNKSNIFKGVQANTINVTSIENLGIEKSWTRPSETGPRNIAQGIGRVQELEEMHQILSASQGQSTTLLVRGLHGVGKSTLAAMYVNRYGTTVYNGGTLWVKLGQQFNPEQDLKITLLQWAKFVYKNLELFEQIGNQRVEVKPDSIRSLLSGHGKLLVVFDNVHAYEHFQAFVEAIPSEADIILTSNTPNKFTHSDFLFRQIEVTHLNPNDSHLLLKRYLPDLPENLLLLLAHRFDHHPTALTQIANILQSRAAPLEAANDLLQGKNDTQILGPIKTAFRLNYKTLEGKKQHKQLRMLSILPLDCNFNVELAAAIWNEQEASARESLEELYSHSLATPLENGRWEISPFLSDYLAPLLQENEAELKEAQDGYFNYIFTMSQQPESWYPSHPDFYHLHTLGELFIAEIEETFSYDPSQIESKPITVVTPEQRHTWEQVAIYLQNAFAYLFDYPEYYDLTYRWLSAYIAAASAVDVPEAISLGWFLLGYWHLIGEKLTEANNCFEKVEEVGEAADPIIRGYALLGIGTIFSLMGKAGEAITVWQKTLDFLIQSDSYDPQLHSIAHVRLSDIYLALNDHENARYYLLKAVEIMEEDIQDDQFKVIIMRQLGNLHLYQSNPQEALVAFKDAQQIISQMNDIRMAAEIPIDLGWAHWGLGEFEIATDHFNEAIKKADQIQYLRLKPRALLGLASCDYLQQNLENAQKTLLEALSILKDIEDNLQEAQIRNLLGSVYRALGQPDTALEFLQTALQLLSSAQNATTSVEILNTTCQIYQETDRLTEGINYLNQTIPHVDAINNIGAKVTLYNWLALFSNGLGNTRKAISYFDYAQTLIVKIENESERATTLMLNAQYYRYLGEVERASQIVEQVSQIWRKLNNHAMLGEVLLEQITLALLQQNTHKAEQIIDELTEIIENSDNKLLKANYCNQRGMLYLHNQILDDAQLMLERANQINESLQNSFLKMLILNNLAIVHLNKQEINQAETHLQQSLLLAQENNNPSFISLILSNLGFVSFFRGNISNAQKHLFQAIETLEKAGLFVDAGNQSIDMLRAFVEIFGRNRGDSPYSESLNLLLQVTNWEGVQLVVHARATNLFDFVSDALLQQTIVDAQRNQQHMLERALRSYRHLLSVGRDNKSEQIPYEYKHNFITADIELWWGYLQRQNWNYSDALAHINRAIDMEPDNLEALLERAWVFNNLGHSDAAISVFDRISQQKKKEYRVYQGKAVVHFRKGQHNQAMTFITQAINLEPRNSFNYQWRAAIFHELNDLESSREDLAKAIKLAPEKSDHRYWYALLLLEMGEIENAQIEFSKVIKLDEGVDGNLSFDYFWRGVVHNLLNEKEKGRFDWKKGSSYSLVGLAAWSLPLYQLIVMDNVDLAIETYLKLFQRPFPSFVASNQLQHLRLLKKLNISTRDFGSLEKLLAKNTFET